MGSNKIGGAISVGFSFSNYPSRTIGDGCTKNAPGRQQIWLDLGLYGQNNNNLSFQYSSFITLKEQ